MSVDPSAEDAGKLRRYDDEIKEVPISQKGKESDIVPPLETTEPIDEIEPDTKPRPSFID